MRAFTVASGRNANMSSACWMGEHFALKLFGQSASMGSSASKTLCQPGNCEENSPMKPSNTSPMVCKTFTRFQLTSVSQSVLAGLSSLTAPGRPVSKAMTSFSLSSFSISWHLNVNMTAYSSLSFSNRPRHTMTKSSEMKERNNSAKRSSLLSFASAMSIDLLNMMMNQSKENWYIGSMVHKSPMMKYKAAHLNAWYLYTCRTSAICWAVISCCLTCSSIFVPMTFELLSVSMSSSSSRMSPDAELRRARILSSSSLSCAFARAESSTRLTRFCSVSGSSAATTMPSIWSCRPSSVAMKFKMPTATQISGGKCGLGSFVVMYNLKSLDHSIVESPNRTMSRVPCLNVAFCSTGSKIASKTSSMFSKSTGLPNTIAFSSSRT
mmetsp:Transcript_39913/g.120545  ORF Transcript_39913/g.120545 Transcript_39913/m.120545 type:complete len:381 (+) Transcript_39913:2019-3161(+)